ncbi:hypothetical protein, partial [Segatella hominis]|uniref:hypothetical protein n=1 Tax=Segatella hominis TaxID=2518605 RepID=UPI001F327F9B
KILFLYAPVSQILRKSMFNIHFLPIILLCFFTKTAFGALDFCISALFFRHFRGGLNRKNSLKITFPLKKIIKFDII